VSVRVKVDEDLPAEIASLVREAGHDAATVAEQGLSGSPDQALWESVQPEKRCLLTADKGFANAQSYPPGTHSGVVLLRLPRESRKGYIELTQSLLREFDLESASGAIVVATPAAIRLYRGE
jgi:predicted nuclease of predicted toxin-antitoxin system